MTGRFHDTVLSIYDAAADSTLWPQVLQRVAEQVNAVGCIVFEWNNLGTKRKLAAPIVSNFYDRVSVETYLEKCFLDEVRDQDIFETHSLATDEIDLIQDDVLAASVDELRLLPNVQVLEKLGILHRAAGLLNKDNTAVSRFSVQLSNTRGRLSSGESAHLAAILPHVAKALELGRPARQLALEHESMIAALDKLRIGVCILDERGRVVVSNEEFKRQREKYGVFQISKRGILELATPDNQNRFESLKDNALNHGMFGARPRKEAIGADEDSFLCIEIVPLNQSQEIGSKMIGGSVLYSTDTSQPILCNTLLLQKTFGLTSAELQLADLIAEGLTNIQISKRRNRAVATINAQVKSILAKTQCNTRTQFVRLMMSFGADFLSTRKEVTNFRPFG